MAENSRRTINDFTDKELADMVRESGYIDTGVTFGDGPHDSRFLLVLAVPYGNRDGVTDLPGALEGFRDLVTGEGCEGTNYQVYDDKDGSFCLENEETIRASEEVRE